MGASLANGGRARANRDSASEPITSTVSRCRFVLDAQAAVLGDLGELWGRGPWRTRALLGLGLATVGLATYWGIFAWSPELVRDVLGLRVSDPERTSRGERRLHGDELHRRAAGALVFCAVCLMARPAVCVCRLSRRCSHHGTGRVFVAPPVTPRPSGCSRSWRFSCWECTQVMRFISPSFSRHDFGPPARVPVSIWAVCLGAVILLVRGSLGGVAGPALGGGADVGLVLDGLDHSAVCSGDPRPRPAGVKNDFDLSD